MTRTTTLVLLMLLVAGCVGTPSPLDTDAADVAAGVILTPEGRVEVDVPVDVVVLGFTPGVADALAARLQPERVEMMWADDWRDVPPDLERPPHAPTFKDALHAPPLVPTAHYRVTAADDALTRDFLHAAAASEVAPGVLDANAAETWLAHRLDLDPDRPLLLLVHGGDVLGDHAWRYTFVNGWLEPVRVFGEREPVLVLDVSAKEDPSVVSRTPLWDDTVLPAIVGGRVEPVQAYDRVLPPDGDATVAALADAVVDATRFRLLHGAAVPPPVAPCHGVTLLLAVREAALQGHAPGVRPPEDLVDADALRMAFENLTGEEVHVDLKVLRLPVDDPVLDALLRPGGGAIGGTRGGYDAVRWWLDDHWNDYWVSHNGCEAYVSLVLLGDAGDTNAGQYSGIAMRDDKTGRRVSVSVVPDSGRLLWEGPASGALDDVAAPPEGYGGFEAVMYLYAHETGHLMGQHHPHNFQDPEEGRIELRSWSSVWTAESYQAGYRNWDFGAVEATNHVRNKVGVALGILHHEGRLDDPRAVQALDLVEAQRWRDALDALRPLLAER